MFEKRPTDIQKIGKALMVGLFIAVPLLMFVPNWIVSYDNRVLNKGDHIQVGTTRYGGGPFLVEELTTKEVTATNLETGITVTIPREQATIIP